MFVGVTHRKLLTKFLQVPQKIVVDAIIADVIPQPIQLQRVLLENILLVANDLPLLFVALKCISALLLVHLDLAVIAVDLVFLTIELFRGVVLVA